MPQDDDHSSHGLETPHAGFARPQRVAVVQSAWHRNMVEQARGAFLREAQAWHIGNIDLFEVPGSFEIPLHVQILARTRRYTALVAMGLVVENRFVAETVIRALMDVQLRTEVPVFSAVLAPEQFHDSTICDEALLEHFIARGVEVARACAGTLLSLERLGGQVAAGIS
ncbi:MAG: 6,7-dimethyl-8-ribityllumazine synthase [Alphaproteobacteria bacterium]|nr:6,7-dimethyl-8-ribityllumazine synthase [Alphaproteobacteria bacterium]